MPHLRFRSISKVTVQSLSLTLPPELAPLMQTSEDNFTFEWLEGQFYSHGQPTLGDPFIEVWWFERSEVIREQAAQIITAKIKALLPDRDVVVVFLALAPSHYYENGVHF